MWDFIYCKKCGRKIGVFTPGDYHGDRICSQCKMKLNDPRWMPRSSARLSKIGERRMGWLGNWRSR